MPLKTPCHKQLRFESLFSKDIVADFDGGKITSDAGCLLLRELDEKHGISNFMNRAVSDPRDPARVTHEQQTLIRQRLVSISLGYEDANDANTLRRDPGLKTACNHLPDSSGDLASQPTLSRLENRTTRKDMYRLSQALFDSYVASHPKERDVIIIDMDSTDDPTHGKQQLTLFHGYYGQYMYHPLLVFDGITGYPMAAVLRPGNAHASWGAKALLKRLIARLKAAWPKAKILFRGDAGFAIPGIYRLLEKKRVSYVIALITNDRLRRNLVKLAKEAKEVFGQTQQKQRLFTAFTHRAKSWKKRRRVVGKAEHQARGANQRFVVTNIHNLTPQHIYDEIYVLRGEAENRIKELKLYMACDRTSCHRFLANQFRLLLHTFAYCLVWHLRQYLTGTELAFASMHTLRLKLLKIGARIRETSRKVWFHMASGYPHKELFVLALENIRAAPT